MRVLLDEVYPPALAEALRIAGIEASTVGERGLSGWSDPDVLDAATAEGWVLLTENVADFAGLTGERVATGGHHPGVLIALSSRFSRRPSGLPKLTRAVIARAADQLDDRLVYWSNRSNRRTVLAANTVHPRLRVLARSQPLAERVEIDLRGSGPLPG